MWVQIDRVNETDGYSLGDSTWEDAGTDNVGEIFRHCQREFGRCTSKLYIDHTITGVAQPIGWTFEKQERYEDTHEPFILSTWAALHKEKPTLIYHHHILGE